MPLAVMVFSLKNTVKQKVQMSRSKHIAYRNRVSTAIDHAGNPEDISEDMLLRTQSVREYLDDIERTSKNDSVLLRQPSNHQTTNSQKQEINYTNT